MHAFHNDPAIKEKYVERVRAHIRADELVRGATGHDGKGCAVWCTLDAYKHARYPIELGIPTWLALLEDDMFEYMSVEKSRTWPLDFLQAAHVGIDLDVIKGPFLIIVLRRSLTHIDGEKYPDVVSMIERSIALWQRNDVGSEEWFQEAQATETAAMAAARATAARTAVAVAWAAARVAETAAGEVAWAAAWAEEAASEAPLTKKKEEYDYFADELLRLMAEA